MTIVIVGGTIGRGLIPAFLDDSDPRPAREIQRSLHCGLAAIDGFTARPRTYVLSYRRPTTGALSTLLFVAR